MARGFRPVQEIWSEASDAFLPSDDLEIVLLKLADLAFAGATEADDYVELRSIWIEDANNFFDYIKEKSTGFLISALASSLSLSLDGRDELEALLENIKSLDTEWRKAIQEDGSLNFYIDRL